MLRNFALVAGLALVAPAAFAQTAAPLPPGMDAAAAAEAARNQLGVLKYCNAEGFTGEEAIASQEKLLGMLPPAPDAAAGDAAEAKGVEGIVSISGTEVSLQEASEGQGTTVEAQCKQIEAAVNQIAAQLPAN